jgi:hypothetical protein
MLHAQPEMVGVEIGQAEVADQPLFLEVSEFPQSIQIGGMFEAPPMELHEIEAIDLHAPPAPAAQPPERPRPSFRRESGTISLRMQVSFPAGSQRGLPRRAG